MPLRAPLLAPACAALALLTTALLAGCGSTRSADSAAPFGGTGTAKAGDEMPPREHPNAEPEASFMRVGPLEAAAAASAMPSSPPPPPTSLSALPPGSLPDKKPFHKNVAPPPDPKANAEPTASGTSEHKKLEAAVVDSRGGLSEEDVRTAISSKRSSFRACYDLGAKAAPDFAGSITLRVAINPAGNVASAEATSSTGNQSVDACVRDEVRKLTFKVTGGGAVVVFPIAFGK